MMKAIFLACLFFVLFQSNANATTTLYRLTVETVVTVPGMTSPNIAAYAYDKVFASSGECATEKTAALSMVFPNLNDKKVYISRTARCSDGITEITVTP